MWYRSCDLLLSLLGAALLWASVVQSETTFCYMEQDCGPSSSYWPGACQSGKTGGHQSPIDLTSNLLNTLFPPLGELNMNVGYSSPQFYVQDNGHTIQVSFTPSLTSGAKLSGFGLSGEYILANLHYHWGQNDLMGSEHSIDGHHYPMEMHMVHYSSRYPSFQAAVAATNDPQSLAVVARFLTPGSIFFRYDRAGPFDTLTANLPTSFEAQPILIQETLNLESYLPKSGEKYYRYVGSLTTPNCTEDVIWTVLANPVIVNPLGIEKFRTVKNHEGRLLGENARPTQPLNGRKVQVFHKQ